MTYLPLPNALFVVVLESMLRRAAEWQRRPYKSAWLRYGALKTKEGVLL